VSARRRVATGLLVLLVLAPVPGHAFGPNGHMTVGTIADALLAGTKAATEARKILGTNLRTASVWADCAKGVNPKTFKYEGAGKFPECAVYEQQASEQAMERFVRRNATQCTAPHNTEVCHKQYHYTDVAIQRASYMKGLIGTSDQDIVSAVSAAIAVLQDAPSPVPFNLSGKREALRLLVHYVGDLHQPLHVAAVYIDGQGHVVDPDTGTFDPQTETHGGNDLLVGTMKMHGQWDAINGPFTSGAPSAAVLKQARSVSKTSGPLLSWSTAWATETLALGKDAYDGVTFSKEDAAHHYRVTLPAGYDTKRGRVQRERIVTAGARLAQILKEIWPD
jgi:hypothetical protein